MLGRLTVLVGWIALAVCTAEAQSGSVFNLVHWGDLHGRFSPAKGRGRDLCELETDPECYGGLSRISSLCYYEKQTNPETLCLDAGDIFAGSPWTQLDTNRTYLKAMNTFVDGVVLGNHDFDYGIDYLVNFIDNATFPVLGACNMDLSEEPRLDGKVQKWMTRTFDSGLKVAVFGITNVLESSRTSLTENITFIDPLSDMGLQKCMNDFEVDNPGGGWVYGVLSHSGFEVDMAIASNFSAELSWIVGGHDHMNLFPTKISDCLEGTKNVTTGVFTCDTVERSRAPYPVTQPGVFGSVQVLHAGWGGKYAGVLSMQYDNNQWAIQGFPAKKMVPMGLSYNSTGYEVKVAENYWVQLDMQPTIWAFAAYPQTILGVLPFDLQVLRPDIYIKPVAAGFSSCNSMIWKARALGIDDKPAANETKMPTPVVCMQHAQVLRRTLPGGDVSVANVRRMMPPEENVYMMAVEVSVDLLRRILEVGVSALNATENGVLMEPDGRYIHVGGGLTFDIDLTQPPFQFNSSTNEIISEGSRISNLQHDCQPFDESKPVIVVTNSLMGTGVGEFIAMRESTPVMTWAPLLADLFSDWIAVASWYGGGVVPNQLIIAQKVNNLLPGECGQGVLAS